MIPALIILGVVVLIVIVIASIYNKLVRLRNFYKNAFAQIDVQLKRRYDLIPNLVETVKGYMKHEAGTLEAVMKARGIAAAAAQGAAANPGDPQAMRELSGAEAALSGSLARVFALTEAYPDLKANTNMMQLSEELTSTENRIAFSRQAFNDAVTSYNNSRETFPSNIFAGMFNFTQAELLQATESAEERKAPKVAF